MRRSSLTLVGALLVLGCPDDVTPGSDSTGSTGSTGADTSTSGPPITTEGSGSTTDPTTGLDSSSGPGSQCGNGVVEDDEQCDDHNTLNDDDCYDDCTIPYEVLWTQSVHGGGSDYAVRAIFDGAGNLYVTGATDVAGQGSDLWIHQFLPDGSAGWTYGYDDADVHLDDRGSGLAWHPSGDLLVVGTTETAAGDDILVMRLGIDDQVPVWIDVYDGPGSGPDPFDDADFGRSVTAAANGDVLVAGSERVDGQEYDAWLRRYDADGVELWTQAYDDATVHGTDTGVAVLEDSTGAIYLVGETELAPSTYGALVRKLDGDGTELWVQTVPDHSPIDARLDGMDDLILAGVSWVDGDMWIAKYDADFTEIATTTYDGPSALFDLARGVAVDASGDVYVGGMISVVGEQANIWVGRYPPDLQLRWWSDSHGGEALLGDQANGVAVSDDGTRVAVVGLETVIGEDTNFWVRVYQNNPTPAR
ncbi:MAG: hypothetical protein KDK70_01785 [Myxococcales bacterium]|nr:hypothetical protein [Myxococcales bacterium]